MTNFFIYDDHIQSIALTKTHQFNAHSSNEPSSA